MYMCIYACTYTYGIVNPHIASILQYSIMFQHFSRISYAERPVWAEDLFTDACLMRHQTDRPEQIGRVENSQSRRIAYNFGSLA